MIYQTGKDPEQVIVGQFSGATGLDLVTVNAGSNDLSFFADFGPGREIDAGGVNLVEAVAGDFSGDGITDLVVAHDDGHFTLLQGGSDGLHITQEVATDLRNVSDMTLGSVSDGALQVYATTDGISAAIPVNIAFDATTVPSESSGTIDVARSQVTEFSTSAGNDLEIVATVVLQSEIAPRSQNPSRPARYLATASRRKLKGS